jgi:hypothetical protein
MQASYVGCFDTGECAVQEAEYDAAWIRDETWALKRVLYLGGAFMLEQPKTGDKSPWQRYIGQRYTSEQSCQVASGHGRRTATRQDGKMAMHLS